MTEHADHINKAPLPEWVLPLFRASLKRITDESRFLHLTMQGLNQITNRVEIVEYFKETGLEMDKERDWDADLLRARQDVKWVNEELQSGFPILHSHSIVALWSIVEVFCEDLAACWLLNKPDAWKIPEVNRLKITLADYEVLSPDDRARYAIIELSRSLSLQFKTGVGKFSPILKLFGLEPRIGDNLRRALHELCQVRNVIVHCGGRVDRKLVQECPWLSSNIGDRIKISHEIYYWYYIAAERFLERVQSQTLITLGFEGCNCPGMDEIHERPIDNTAKEIQMSDLNSLHITTRPDTFHMENGRTGVAWKATRLTFKRKGIDLLKNPKELIINQIIPNSEAEGYIPGYFVLTLQEFRDNFPNVISSKSYKSKAGVYNPRKPPESMKKFFMRNS